VFSCRVHLSSSQSTVDNGSDSNDDDAAVNRPVPGSAVRARKSAAAKELAEAEVQQERHVSTWIYVKMLSVINRHAVSYVCLLVTFVVHTSNKVNDVNVSLKFLSLLLKYELHVNSCMHYAVSG